MPHYYHHPPYFARAPRRIVWFVLGGLTATWWIKHKEMRELERGGHYYAWCSSSKFNHHRQQQEQIQDEAAAQAHTPPLSQGQQWARNAQQQQQQFGAAPQYPQMPFGWTNQHWEQEKEKMWALGRQAGDTVSLLSQATPPMADRPIFR